MVLPTIKEKNKPVYANNVVTVLNTFVFNTPEGVSRNC